MGFAALSVASLPDIVWGFGYPLFDFNTTPLGVLLFIMGLGAVVRERFGGKVTYASVPFEGVDWTPFDIVSVDAHRSKEIAHVYQQGIRTLVAQGKPVAITEFGCTTYHGAADHGALSGAIIEYDGTARVRLNGDYVRDEQEQAKTSDGDRAMTPQIHRLSVPRASSPAANASCAAPPTREILRGRRCTW